MSYRGKEYWVEVLESMLEESRKQSSKNTLKPRNRISWFKVAAYLVSVLAQVDKQIMEEDIKKRIEVLEYAISRRKDGESVREA